MRILAIDDEVSFIDLLKQYFEPRGYIIDTTADGMTALELFRKTKYDVVLLDLKMAGLSGDEVMSQMKYINKNIRFIFITAYSDSGKTKARLLSEGAFAFIEKPVTSLKSLEDLVNGEDGAYTRKEA